MHFRLDFTDILNFIKFTLRYPLSPLNISPCDFSAREMLTLVVCTRIQSDADVPKRRLDAKYANYTRRHTENTAGMCIHFVLSCVFSPRLNVLRARNMFVLRFRAQTQAFRNLLSMLLIAK